MTPTPTIPAIVARSHDLSDEHCTHIGYWAQYNGDGSGLPWPGDHCNPTMSDEERERVAALLDSHPPTETYRGSAPDRLNPSQWVGNGEVRINGYVYPTGLSHYVREYGLVLPQEFLDVL